MTGAILLLIGIGCFAFAYCLYGNFLQKVFHLDNSRETPANTRNDGIDYSPTLAPVLFGHHFASIAGAGPIVGPILAATFGWLPAFLWILIGCIFIGAVHDFSALFLSVRNQGRSIAYVIEKEIGYAGRQLFLIFSLTTLLLVIAIFTLMVADGFLATPAVATSSLLFIFIAPIFGITVTKRLLSFLEATIIFVPILFLCVWIGTVIPFDLTAFLAGNATRARIVWILVLLYYAFIASVIPVWIMLQPRDYLNSYLLYAMMVLGIGSIFCVNPTLELPAVRTAGNCIPGLFPMLFVTIACGACSGFHAMVASGTTSKQIAKEKHIRPIAYGGMLLEGILALVAIISVAYLKLEDFQGMKLPPPILMAHGLAHFAEKIGINPALAANFVSLAISAFLLTTLDTSTRLARFLWQELILPRNISLSVTSGDNAAPLPSNPLKDLSPRNILSNRWLGTPLVVISSGVIALSGKGMEIWPVFGSANQLLAALTFLCVTLWLFRKKRPVLFAMLPMLFMMTISIWALICLLLQNWAVNNLLVAVTIILLLLTIFLIGIAIPRLIGNWRKGREA